jgi:hypothetical protein
VEREIALLDGLDITADTDYETFKDKVTFIWLVVLKHNSILFVEWQAFFVCSKSSFNCDLCMHCCFLNLKALHGLPMSHGGHSIVLRGLYALQLAPWVTEYPLGDKLRVLGLKEIIGSTAEVQQKVNSIYEFIGLPPHDIPDVAAKNTRAYDPIKPEVSELLCGGACTCVHVHRWCGFVGVVVIVVRCGHELTCWHMLSWLSCSIHLIYLVIVFFCGVCVTADESSIGCILCSIQRETFRDVGKGIKLVTLRTVCDR